MEIVSVFYKPISSIDNVICRPNNLKIGLNVKFQNFEIYYEAAYFFCSGEFEARLDNIFPQTKAEDLVIRYVTGFPDIDDIYFIDYCADVKNKIIEILTWKNIHYNFLLTKQKEVEKLLEKYQSLVELFLEEKDKLQKLTGQ